MTAIDAVGYSPDNSTRIQRFVLASPASGANNIVVSISSNITFGSILSTGISVTGSTGYTSQTPSNNGGGSSSHSQSVTSSAGNLVAGFCISGNTITGVTSGGTQRQLQNTSTATAGDNMLLGTWAGGTSSTVGCTNAGADFISVAPILIT